MQTRFALAPLILAPVASSGLTSRKQASRRTKEGVHEESEAESVSRSRYADCDFRFYALLPKGFRRTWWADVQRSPSCRNNLRAWPANGEGELLGG